MSFTINIVADNAAEAIEQLLLAASFYQKHPEIAERSTAEEKPKATRAKKSDAASAAASSTPEPASQAAPTATETTAATDDPKFVNGKLVEAGNADAVAATAPAGSTANPTSAPADATPESSTSAPGTDGGNDASEPAAQVPPPVDFDKLRTEVRATLAPLMKDPAKAAKVTELIKSFGVAKLTEIPNEKLALALVAAKDI